MSYLQRFDWCRYGLAAFAASLILTATSQENPTFQDFVHMLLGFNIIFVPVLLVSVKHNGATDGKQAG